MENSERLDEVLVGMFKPCTHPRTEVRFKTDSLGRKLLGTQCLVCGEKTEKQWLSQNGVDMSGVRPFDDVLPCEYQKREAERRRVSKAAEKLQKHLEREQYIRNSPEWWSIRERVMRRDDHWCQGCFEAPATEVHHTTYEHLYAEILWELQAVCRECHERIHGLIK